MLLGSAGAPRHLVVFEDPQCPFCRRFEEVSGGVLRTARTTGTVAVEYRMRCFLGIESVRADNALALAAEERRFDELREQLFEAQREHGLKAFLEMRDGPFQPEPMGPRSAKGRAERTKNKEAGPNNKGRRR